MPSGRISHIDALVAGTAPDGEHRVALDALDEDQLGDGEVTVAVAWSGVNYKDGLAIRPDGRVAQIDPLVPGIDLAGRVVASDAAGVPVDSEVIVHGHDLGTAHHGGYATHAHVPAGWVVPLPDGLTTRQAMTLGTAGFTAGLSVHLLEGRGLAPGDGPVLVTGATGGVGSAAVSMLAGRGYDVVASTGKADAADWLRGLGAGAVIDRDEVAGDGKPLSKQRWAAAVDCVGGGTLAGIIPALRRGGAVAVTGNTGGPKLETTVFPFILRGVAMLGADSVGCPDAVRLAVWQRLAGDLRPNDLDGLATGEVGLGDDLVAALRTVLEGGMRGRTIVRIGG